MQRNIIEGEEGTVWVEIKSTRGTDPRDDDQVRVQGAFDDIETAQSESHKLTEVAKDRLRELRRFHPDREESETDDSSTGVEETVDQQAESGGERADDSPQEEPDGSGVAVDEVSKVYIGDGARVKGWTPLPRDVVFEQIAPLVSQNLVDDSEDSVKMNFSDDVPLSGWKNVDKEVVREAIRPVVAENRLPSSILEDSDGSEHGQEDTSEDGEATCPLQGCAYSGSINEVLGHLMGRDDHEKAQLPELRCPVEGCSRTGPIDTIGGHMWNTFDGEHDTDLLLETGIF